ncbi:hypothetical protein L3Y34_007074 [Caenorhabditis briggsae]|uniref:Uncharacterized protein n=1 Tax=Caenorhabditis briggsae TaxID=6238 RepID=A0AAE9A0W3_CAEBR|nr:hypothetical protein L3Y34_007074 [Caenorhabditis briggsae]
MSVAKSYHKEVAPVLAYCAEHTVVQEQLQEQLQKETLSHAPMSMMLGAPEVLSFGQNFIRSFGGKRVLDIGIRFGGIGDKLIADGQSGTFDFAFIDADKANYSNYYDRSVTLLRKGGVIFVDNSLWSGSVCDPAKRAESESTQAIHDANDKIYQDDRTYSALLNLGDGTHVAFKK